MANSASAETLPLYMQAGPRLPCRLRGEHVRDALHNPSKSYPSGAVFINKTPMAPRSSSQHD